MFMSEPDPARGRPIPVTDRIVRVVAPNQGPMTYHGTNTYIVRSAAGAIVIDPGPDLDSHLGAVIDAAGGAVHRILLTHDHHDHAGGVASLVDRTGATVAAAGAGSHGYRVATRLADDSLIDGFLAIATPGHAPDHLCFRLDEVIFTGDHLMGWAPTAILAPEGNSRHYLDSLARIAAIRCRTYLPGHGPPVRASRRFIDGLTVRADERERTVRDLIAQNPSDIGAIVDAIHGGLGPETRHLASRSIEAVLTKLETEGRAICDGSTWRALQ